jgi:hypothetical protein
MNKAGSIHSTSTVTPPVIDKFRGLALEQRGEQQKQLGRKVKSKNKSKRRTSYWEPAWRRRMEYLTI